MQIYQDLKVLSFDFIINFTHNWIFNLKLNSLLCLFYNFP